MHEEDVELPELQHSGICPFVHSGVPTTRLAPSPTGALHLGNARTFLINWAMARQGGWRVVLRIEDLDGPRVKAGSAEQAVDVLRWLGLDWDGAPMLQSGDLSPYRGALDRLWAAGLTYPCPATRREIEAAGSAPHAGDHETRYPGLYRPPGSPPIAAGSATATRLIVPDGIVEFDDTLHGRCEVDVQGQVGDFIVETKAGVPAYQLAVVVDDAGQGVTEVVRGDDLLDSTARQVLLYGMLELGDPPRYTHVPLVLGPDGRRLAKRHGDTRLVMYRDAGVPAERVVGLLASWCGLGGATGARGEGPQPMTAAAFAARFDLAKLPRDTVTFRNEDHAWLMGTA